MHIIAQLVILNAKNCWIVLRKRIANTNERVFRVKKVIKKVDK